MNVVKKFDDDFNPLNGSSICYRVIPRDELEKWLKSKNLIGHNHTLFNLFFFRKLHFNDSNLGNL